MNDREFLLNRESNAPIGIGSNAVLDQEADGTVTIKGLTMSEAFILVVGLGSMFENESISATTAIAVIDLRNALMTVLDTVYP
jgi:hypothetical protein